MLSADPDANWVDFTSPGGRLIGQVSVCRGEWVVPLRNSTLPRKRLFWNLPGYRTPLEG